MRALRCPRCQAVVQVADGEAPQCTSCGFGRQIQQVTQNPLPKTRRTGVLVAAVVIVAVLVVGVAAASLYAFAGNDKPAPGAFSEQESRARVEEALAALPGDMATDGKIRLMTGSVEFDDAEFMGGMAGTYSVEWGQDGAMKMVASMRQSSGPTTVEIDFTMYCVGDRTVIEFGETAVESRASEWGDCSEFQEAEGELDGFLLTDLESDGVEIDEVTSTADGRITARLSNETATIRVNLDAQGRLVEMKMDSQDEGRLEMAFVYGTRQTIGFPSGTVRAPAEISGNGGWSGGTYTWDSYTWGPSAPLDEFEVRLMDGDSLVASFRLDGGPQSDGDIAFSFQDDGDGEFGGDDSFTIHADTEYEVVVWDLWADRDIEDGVDMPGPHWLAGVAMLALFALRRRQ